MVTTISEEEFQWIIIINSMYRGEMEPTWAKGVYPVGDFWHLRDCDGRRVDMHKAKSKAVIQLSL